MPTGTAVMRGYMIAVGQMPHDCMSPWPSSAWAALPVDNGHAWVHRQPFCFASDRIDVLDQHRVRPPGTAALAMRAAADQSFSVADSATLLASIGRSASCGSRNQHVEHKDAGSVDLPGFHSGPVDGGIDRGHSSTSSIPSLTVALRIHHAGRETGVPRLEYSMDGAHH